MKSCFSVVLSMLLVPLLFITIICSLFVNVVVNENTYKILLAKPELKAEINDFVSLSIRDNLIRNSESLKSLLNNTNGENAIKKFISVFSVDKTFTDNIVGLVKYIDGKESTLNIYITPVFTESDINVFKQNVITTVSEGILSLKKCDTLEESKNLNCRLPSLTSQDILGKVKEAADSSINFSAIKDSLKGRLPISDSLKTQLTEIRQGYSTFKTALIIAWIICGVLLLLIIALNIRPEFTVLTFFSRISVILAVLFGFLAFLENVLARRGEYIVGTQLNMSSNFNVDTSNAAVNLINSILKNLFEMGFINFCVIAGILLLMGIILWLIDFAIKKRKDSLEFKKQYYIPAYSKKASEGTEKN